MQILQGFSLFWRWEQLENYVHLYYVIIALKKYFVKFYTLFWKAFLL